jgi:cobalt/nickel transport system permease protein
MISIAAVLLIQCLFFADGVCSRWGVILQHGRIDVLFAYPLFFKPFPKKESPNQIDARSVLSVVVGLQLGAFSVWLETLVSVYVSDFRQFSDHDATDSSCDWLVEGLVTGAILVFVYQARPNCSKAL